MENSIFLFVISSIIIAITPGMTVALIIANTLKDGLTSGLITVVGGIAAILSMLLILVIGFDYITNHFSFILLYIQLFGGFYLVYIGIQTVVNRHNIVTSQQKLAGKNYFTQGFLLMWSNPKTLLFLGAFIPPFVNLEGNITNQLVMYVLTFAVIAWISDSLYAVFISFLSVLLSRYRVLLNTVSGISITCIGGWLIYLTILQTL